MLSEYAQRVLDRANGCRHDSIREREHLYAELKRALGDVVYDPNEYEVATRELARRLGV